MSKNETRKAATERVTAACVLWLWKKGCRSIAPEIGYRHSGLVSAWKSMYRLDLVGIAGPKKRSKDHRIFVVEVKSTKADLTREHLDKPLAERQRLIRAKSRSRKARAAYRWEIDPVKHGVIPYLAVADDIPQDCYAFLPMTWGVLRIKGMTVKVERHPSPQIVATPTQAAKAWRALAEAHSMYRLPRMNRRKPTQILQEMKDGEYGKSWVNWGKKMEKLIAKEEKK